MEDRVLDIMKEVFGLEDVDETCSQKNCEKWDSLAHLNLIVELESEFNVSFEPEDIADMTSFSDVINHLEKVL